MRSYREAVGRLIMTWILCTVLTFMLYGCGDDKSCDGGGCTYVGTGSVGGDGTIGDGSTNDNSPQGPIIVPTAQPVIVPPVVQ